MVCGSIEKVLFLKPSECTHFTDEHKNKMKINIEFGGEEVREPQPHPRPEMPLSFMNNEPLTRLCYPGNVHLVYL